MSLTGLFLCLFLVIHLIGNLQLLYNDNGVAFNAYSEFMGNNPLIKTISFGLYASILLHAIQGILIYFKNKKARGASKYAVSNKSTTFSARNMALLGSLIFIFIAVHMSQFWYGFKFGDPAARTAGYYGEVQGAFQHLWIVIFYVLGQVAIAFHLIHGFQSAFQTLGLNHKKYTPFIKGAGIAYSILIPLAFAAIPVYMYFFT